MNQSPQFDYGEEPTGGVPTSAPQIELRKVDASLSVDQKTQTIAISPATTLTGTAPDETPVEPEKPFKVGDASFDTLKDAIDNVGDNTTVTLNGDFTGNESNTAAIPENVTLFVESGTLSLPYAALANMVASQGSIEVNDGANLVLNGASYIGSTDDYYFKVTDGTMALRDFDGNLSGFKMDIVVTEDSTAEIPSNKNVTLQPNKWGADLTVEAGATLDVNGGLRGISGSGHPSAITVDGTLDCTDGFVSLAANPTIAIGENGTFMVGSKGIITDGITQGYPASPNAYATSNKISIAGNGTILIDEDNTLNSNLANLVLVSEGTKGTVTDENGNTVIGVVSGDAGSAEARIGLKYYSSLDGEDGALASAESGDTVILRKNATVSETTGNTIKEGVTLSVPNGKTLTVEIDGAGMLNSEGTLSVAAGGKVVLPANGDDTDTFIGGSSDEGARFQLAQGSVIFDMGEKALTLTSGSSATIPDGKTTYLQLGSGNISIALNGTIEENATLTVNGTLKAVSSNGEAGTQLTVNGTLDASNGMLTIADKASMTVNGTLKLPLLSTTDIEGQGPGTGTGLLGDHCNQRWFDGSVWHI